MLFRHSLLFSMREGTGLIGRLATNRAFAVRPIEF